MKQRRTAKIATAILSLVLCLTLLIACLLVPEATVGWRVVRIVLASMMLVVSVIQLIPYLKK